MKNSSESHLYLYAKNWYQKSSNVIDDLKRIYADRNLGDVDQAEHISVNDVISCLLQLTYKHIIKDHDYHYFSQFVCDIGPDKWNYWNMMYPAERKPYDFNIAVIKKCLSVLANVRLDEIPEGLDDPDEKILPLRKV